MKGIIGKKVGMTQIFDEKGNVIPVTVIETAGNVVTQVKTVETDGYNSIQLGYGEVKAKHLNKPLEGHFKKAGVENKKHLREFRTEDVANYKVGDEVKADIFTAGEKVDVQGTTKGKDSKVLSKDMDNTEDLWDMVLCIIEDQVQWELHQHQVEYLKVKNYQDIWVELQLQYKILML